MKALSLRSRLTLWYTVVLVVVLCAFGADIVWLHGQVGIRRIDRELAAVEATIVKIVGNELREQATPADAAEEACEAVAQEGRAVAILDAHGARLAARVSVPDLEGLLPKAINAASSTLQISSGAWRVRSRMEQIAGTGFTVLVASPLSDVEREQRELWEAMVIGIPIVLLLAGAGGWWLASIGLAPITEMAGRAVRLPLTGSENLGQSTRNDELGQLTRAFNDLVARLRAALQTQQQFMADASHELRTPASIIRSAAEVGLSRGSRSEEEYRETLAIVGNQARRLGRLVEDMLVLARAEAGGYPIHAVDLDLAEIVDDCRRAVKVLATERGVQIQSSAGPEVPFRGDEDLLRRLVLNLLHNAIQHTPADGSVAVTVESRADGGSIRVSDQGPGIPENDRTRIFARFVRLDEARTGSGAGLGLSIAKWIAEAHGGSLVLEASGPTGSTFCATLLMPDDPQQKPYDGSAFRQEPLQLDTASRVVR